jgi:hypothetical protein
MKTCPKCKSSVKETAKFCIKCGFNIKKYEEEQASEQEIFCPECGTKFSGGTFCPECGYDTSEDALEQRNASFNDEWLAGVSEITAQDVANKMMSQSNSRELKALAAFEYEEHTDGTYTLTGLKDKSALNVTVPAGVIAIGDSVFEGSGMINVTLPEGLLQIGRCAFKNCTNLIAVNIPASLIVVGDEAFYGCSILDVDLPSTVRKVGKDALVKTVRWIKAEEARIAEEKRKVKQARQAEIESMSQVGNIVKYGKYHISSANKKEEIDWIVLDVGESSALLVSYYGLDCKIFNDENANATWEICSLRSWLNNDFLNAAFTKEEQERLVVIYDKLFLLDKGEAENYFKAIAAGCQPTPYAKSRGAYEEPITKNGWYWLRTNGYTSKHATYVEATGKVNAYGTDVYSSYSGMVRPAMWVSLENEFEGE